MKHPRPHGAKKEERTHFDCLLWAMQKNKFFYLGLDGTKILLFYRWEVGKFWGASQKSR